MEPPTNDNRNENDCRIEKIESSNSTVVLPQPLTTLMPPNGQYFLDQIKNGLLISKINVEKNRLIIGRAADCDIIMDHPSVSRYHAALLWAPKNDLEYKTDKNKESFWYLIDCGSTHGTICNKTSVETGKMIKINPNNNIFRFGASTRLFTLGSNEEDPEFDNECDEDDGRGKIRCDINENEDGCTWGISMTDCDDETEEREESSAFKSIIAAMKNGQSNSLSPNENVYSENPYKSLQQWFEREGYDFDYKTETINNRFKCIFELPIDDQWIPVEGQLHNKKKDAISDACHRCCKLLDQACLLFSWQKKDNAAEKARKEYYDDDDDDLIDETINIRKKMKKNSSTVVNYESLNLKWQEISEQIRQLKIRLATLGLPPDVTPELPDDMTDSLDIFYATMNQKKYGLTMNEKIEKSNLKMQIKQLEEEQIRIEN
ncbi:Kanadaptin [Sarcoptes scabiei]|uniref:Kanadaptin n=1 Tax=Sarcoptes scabiei TaxID=52283 RepID=A0A834REF6_SARSC|nr:Kanadaptin [Sarcoptes scabiei]